MTPPTYEGHSTVGRIWFRLGSPRTVRVIFIGMLIYFLLIGGLVLGYASVQNCLAKYSDDSAEATRIRVQTAADDRLLNKRVEEVDNSDRARIIANNKILAEVIVGAANNDGIASVEKLREYQATSEASLQIFATNERERAAIRQERARIDAVRTTAPPPAPPSERC